MMFTCRSYTGARGDGHAPRQFLLPRRCGSTPSCRGSSADILANSWYANQVNKRALIEIDGLSLHDSHGLELFKNEGLAPDAAKRVEASSLPRKDGGR